MTTVTVTGSNGFIGKNLVEALSRRADLRVHRFDSCDDTSVLRNVLHETDIVFHLAGVNRPDDDAEFMRGNAGFTEIFLSVLEEIARAPAIVLSSSTQAVLDNPYGISKRAAEKLVFDYTEKTGAPVYVYRLTNVFGKWCRPNYNSVVATFCHNIARNLPITISDGAKELELVYIDDVVAEFLDILDRRPAVPDREYLTVEPIYRTTLGDIAGRICQFRDMRRTLMVPDMSSPLTRRLYATYLSHLEEDDFAYDVETVNDGRGSLVELLKSEHFGQIFISRSRSGIVRGNHYHNTKVEKFCVVQGTAVIRFRHIFSDEILSYHVSGDDIKIVDIPPGYTHSIENRSDGEMLVLFWANEVFDSEAPDTHHCEV